MNSNHLEVTLRPSSSFPIGSILLALIFAIGCFYMASETEGFFCCFLIGIGLVFMGLLFYLTIGSQSAYLRLIPDGIELKFPIKKVTYVPWDEIKKVAIIKIGELNAVGITYTEESNRVGRMARKMNNLFVSGASITLPTYYPIKLGELYLLVYGWKLGHYVAIEDIENSQVNILASVLEYETSLEHKDLDHFGDF